MGLTRLILGSARLLPAVIGLLARSAPRWLMARRRARGVFIQACTEAGISPGVARDLASDYPGMNLMALFSSPAGSGPEGAGCRAEPEVRQSDAAIER